MVKMPNFQILITLTITAVFNPSIGEKIYIHVVENPFDQVRAFISQFSITFQVLYSQEIINPNFLVTGRV